jgi:DNA-binding NarL/FixJ family response regulator
MKSRVVLVDDQPVVLEGLQRVISRMRWPGEVSGTITDPSRLDKSLAAFECDVIVSETKFGGIDLIAQFERAAEKKKLPKLIFYSTNDDSMSIARVLALGAFEFVAKHQPVERLLGAIDLAVEGKAPPSDSLLILTKSRLRRPRQNISVDVPLTLREWQVLQHVTIGLSNREIGRALGISVETAKEHVQNILRKLDVNDRTQAAVWAVKHGLS